MTAGPTDTSAGARTDAERGGPARIEFSGWGLRYPDRDAWAVRGVDLVVQPGERVAIVGPSGAGKSTLLRAVAGVLPDDAGGGEGGDGAEIGDGGGPVGRSDGGPAGGPAGSGQEGRCTVDGRDPRSVRGRVGLVMQDPEAHTVMSRIGDDVAFGPENLGVPRPAIWPAVARALGVVGLDLPLERSTEALSGGQRQRLALAGVLAMRPGTLVLDEPCANLDPEGVAQVRRAVGRALDDTGATFIVVEHRIGTWLDLVDRLVLLAPSGGVVADGRPAEVLAEHHEALVAAGVWVPGPDPEAVPTRPGGAVLLTASELATARRAGEPVGYGIELVLRAGECVAVTGPNGVGKSTLGLTLAGLLRPEQGAVVGTDTLAPPGRPAAPSTWTSTELAARIGTVFQEPAHQFVARTVFDEIAAGPRALGRSEDDVEGRVDEVMLALGLQALADANPFTLSGGEQRRLAIGTVVATHPRVVVLDEPTSGQDRRTWQRIVDALVGLLDVGTAVVVVTHDRALVDALGAQELRLVPTTSPGPGAPRPPVTAPAAVPVTARVSSSAPSSAPASRPDGLRVNPAASLLGVLALAVCLVTSLDVVSAATALLLELVLLPFAGVRPRTMLRRAAPLLVAGPLAAIGIALYGAPSGRTWLDAGFVHVTDGSLVVALATLLRLLALVLPTIAVFAAVDPTDLADGLAQVLRLPARFVLGALAAMRMVTLMREDWRQLGMARRSRGLADHGRLRRGASMAFALLVLALRRATTLAVAMESRGFGAPGRRTWARPSRFGSREWTLMGVLLGIGLVAIAVSVTAGTWHGR